MSAPAPRRVLYVLERYPELSQTFVHGEIAALRAIGWQVDVVALQPGSSGGAEQPAARPVYAGDAGAGERLAALARLGTSRPRALGRYLARERAWPPGGRARLRGAARIAPWVAPAAGADHVHAHFNGEAADIARVLSAWTGTQFSVAVHATDAFVEPERLARNLRAAAFATASCDYVRRRVVDVVPDAASRVHELIAGLDTERFARRAPYRPDGPLVSTGRLVAKKGFDDLVEAAVLSATALDGREVLIVGEGPERRSLESLIERSGAPVRLLGARPPAEVRDLLEEAAAFVLPCKVAADGDRDSMPVAIKEAMALEIPVVATDEVGIPELIAPDRGVLVPPGDPPALARAMDELLATDPAGRVTLGRRGATWVRARCDVAEETARLAGWIAAAGGPDGRQVGGG